jgi:N-methylhydantoinase B/oxoprolinase/acetone carboxylase alpha subunit
LLTADGQSRELPPNVTFQAQPGDRIRIETPGGGGWGLAQAGSSPPVA